MIVKKQEDLERYWNRKAQQVLEGKTIVKAAYMDKEDADKCFGWWGRPIVMILNDGTELIISSDDEGNEAGSLFYATDEEPNGVLPTL